MKLSIRSKLTLVFIFTVTIILIIFSSIIYFSFKKSLENNIESSLITSSKTIIREIFQQDIHGQIIKIDDDEDDDEEKTIAEKFLEEVEELLKPNEQCGQILQAENTDSFILLERSDNFENITIPYDSLVINNVIKKKLSLNPFYIFTIKSAKIINIFVINNNNDHFIIQIAEPLEDMLKSLDRIKFTLLIFSPFFLIILSFFGYGFVKKAFSPIKSVVSDVNRITAEDLSKRIKAFHSKDEIGELVDTFNNMISRLESSFKRIKQFSLDVSHELKTPLTVLKGEIEVALKQKRETDEYIQTLKSLNEEVVKLQNIIDNLFFISNLESDNFEFHLGKADIYEIITEIFDSSYKLAKYKNQNIEMKNITSTEISGDKELLKRLFVNILENAIKYTPINGKIIIEIEKKEKEITVSISDNGIGIKQEFHKKIFDRFFRIDESRTSETGGSGLGLAIVKKIAFLHNAKIEVDSSIGKGSAFSVIFPKSGSFIKEN